MRASSLSGIALVALLSSGCGHQEKVSASSAGEGTTPGANVTVAVAKVQRRSLAEQLKLSSELVPYQEIDVYAKESGYIKELNVDYGSRVKQGDVMAVLEIPELEAQLKQDEAGIAASSDLVTHAQHQLEQVKQQHQPVQRKLRIVGWRA